MNKRIIKNVLAVSVTAAMALSVAACSGKTAESSTSETGSAVESVAESGSETGAAAAAENPGPTEADVEITTDDALLGSWGYTENGITMVYTFKEDNTVSLSITNGDVAGSEATSVDYTYTADGERVMLIIEGESSDYAPYTINGDTLTIGEGSTAMDLTRQ